jgi:predicted ABC-class ATPase
VTSSQAVKIRAEDGRAVQAVDISPFINNLPFGKGTSCFTTSDASGSTSQATNIVEVSEQTCAYVGRETMHWRVVFPQSKLPLLLRSV